MPQGQKKNGAQPGLEPRVSHLPAGTLPLSYRAPVTLTSYEMCHQTTNIQHSAYAKYKGANQHRSNWEADQRLFFFVGGGGWDYKDSTF